MGGLMTREDDQQLQNIIDFVADQPMPKEARIANMISENMHIRPSIENIKDLYFIDVFYFCAAIDVQEDEEGYASSIQFMLVPNSSIKDTVIAEINLESRDVVYRDMTMEPEYWDDDRYTEFFKNVVGRLLAD
jgi:hypothetical protein